MRTMTTPASIAAALMTFFLLLPAELPAISAEPSQPAWARTRSREEQASSAALDQLVGNVDGTARDADTLQAIPNADVFLLEQSVQKGGIGHVIHTDRGDIVLPDVGRAAMHGTTDRTGEFLLNFVPVPFPSKAYTIVISAPGYGLFIVDSATLLPGAVMSLNVDAKLSKESNLFIEPSDRESPLRYRHEMQVPRSNPSSPAAPAPTDDRVTYTILATREGLVGYTTANGHVILPHDRFVALPSVRVLNANDQTDTFQVRLTYGARTVDAPVWDVGPWNTADDYWNPSGIRQMWQDLPQGMPEAQAAYQNSYNSGRDQYGRAVSAPLGIDLADGTFWDDLGMVGNVWISAKYLWKPDVVLGDRVYATADLSVRAAPGGNQSSTEPCGAEGIIKGGPIGASLSRVFYVWWQVQWDDGVQGWSVENQIGKTLVSAASLQTPRSQGSVKPVLAPSDSLRSYGEMDTHADNSALASSARQRNVTASYQYYLPFIGRQRNIVCPQPNAQF